MTTILEALAEKDNKETRERRVRSKRRKIMRELIAEHIDPLMPRTLPDCFDLELAGPSGWKDYFEGVSLHFGAAVDTKDGVLNKRAVGTIDKIAKALKKGGWDITAEPTATAHDYSKDLTISLSAARDFAPSKDGRANASMTFTGMQSTDRCRLVEKEVIVAAVAEHKETRMVVECEEAPA